ncbi:MAG: hypothetical protein AMXMBFR58_25010 [Phycisphaerae bacterium]|nr:hypothetical protein [Phycisphaerales bacterium]
MKRPAFLVMLVCCGGALAQPADVRPTLRTTDCTTSGCHASQISKAVLHGPTAVGACDSCHDYKDVAAHTFTLKRSGRQLCDFCHIDKTGTEGPVVHDPVAKGDCTGCHDPHGSSTRLMLKQDSVKALCTECHKNTMTGAHAHKPAEEDCTKCHYSHTSTHPRLLRNSPQELCLSCHEEVGKSISGSAFPHKPVEDCLNCHSPHATDHAAALKLESKELCISCHQDTGKAIAAATVPHGAVTDAKSCTNCHSPHASNHAMQFVDDPVATCMKCHTKSIKVSDARTVRGVPELTNDSLHRHGPINTGDCSACHDVHGGNQRQLLVRHFSQEFYQPFSEDAYALCFGCHDKSLILAQPATLQTNFRDGTRNLHNVHVVSSSRSRSCRACHTLHASKFQTQVADSVSFGEWKLPINYEPTQTGGSCSPGCHKPAKFDRVEPVNMKLYGDPGAKTTATRTPATKTTAPADPAGKVPADPQAPGR